MRLAHGLERNDNMVRHDLPVSMFIEGASCYQAFVCFESDAAMQH